jgi:thiamine biosynthesis lipoprotein
MIQVKFQAMGCAMAVLLDQEGPKASRILEQVPGWFEEWEQALSRFRPDSDLNLLNLTRGKIFQAGEILFQVIRTALEEARWTNGLVVPTILNSLELAGYERDFDLVSRVQPDRENILPAADTSDWKQIIIEEESRSIQMPHGMRLDLGGVAKGWAAHQAMQRLMEFGPTLVDAGGDIAISGSQSDGQPWLVDIADPLQVQEKLDMLALDKCGVATSGIDHRRWLKGDNLNHHIIDPRTQRTARTDLASVTVIAQNVIQAEAAAKTVMILGSQKGLEWLEDRSGLSGVLAGQDGRLIYSHEVFNYLWRE